MRIRSSNDGDREAISGVHLDAFGESEGPEIAELVEDLLEDPTARPYLSLVAETDGEVVGHVLYTAVRVRASAGESRAQILAPLGVAREFHGTGVGGLLVREGLKRLGEQGVELVFVLGHPGYYPRFGFRPAGARGLEAPHRIPDENVDAWMVTELQPGAIELVEGTVECAAMLQDPKYWRE